MKRQGVIWLMVVVFWWLLPDGQLQAQGPKGKTFGFGLVLGDPTGLSAKLWTNKENAFAFGLGASYFGSPRIQADYLWHFDAFQSSVVKMYAGPGIGIGFGTESSGFWYEKGRGRWYYREGDSFGLAARAIIGINVVPKRTPLEIFVELGPNVGFLPNFGTGIDAGVGIRFYP